MTNEMYDTDCIIKKLAPKSECKMLIQKNKKTKNILVYVKPRFNTTLVSVSRRIKERPFTSNRTCYLFSLNLTRSLKIWFLNLI